MLCVFCAVPQFQANPNPEHWTKICVLKQTNELQVAKHLCWHGRLYWHTISFLDIRCPAYPFAQNGWSMPVPGTVGHKKHNWSLVLIVYVEIVSLFIAMLTMLHFFLQHVVKNHGDSTTTYHPVRWPTSKHRLLMISSRLKVAAPWCQPMIPGEC